MNSIKQQSTHYLTPNKTIETLSVLHQKQESVYYIYNYKGMPFRVFRSKEELNGFFRVEADEHKHFQIEQELDAWLHSVEV